MGEMRGALPGGPVGVLCSAVVCVCHEPGVERLRAVPRASAAGARGRAGGAAPGAEKRAAGTAATAAG